MVRTGSGRDQVVTQMKHEDVPIDKIKLGHRHRIDRGDIESLAANIRDIGLLQPVGVDPFYELIFGMRRLEACKDVLGWKTIPAVILDIESILAGEYAENEFRKEFTPSERAAIGAAIEKEIGKQQGKQLVQNIGQTGPPIKTEDLIAQRAGFGNPTTMGQAQRVVERGTLEVIGAMDSGELSISAAAAISSQPKDEQERIVQMPIDERREIVRRIRQTKADREADERRAYDLRVFRGFAEAVETVANFYEDARDTWAGLQRVSAYGFAEHLDRALKCLERIRREHPNESGPRRNTSKG
jgi:ParB family chromosome partitioning protein